MKRIIFVDFDDTLFVWHHGIDRNGVNTKCFLGTLDYNEVGTINAPLISKLVSAINEDTLIILLSHTLSNKEAYNKQLYCKEYCDGLFDDYICVSSGESKLAAMQVIADEYNVPFTSCYLIDDLHKTRDMVEAAGFQVRTPMEVMLSGIRLEE